MLKHKGFIQQVKGVKIAQLISQKKVMMGDNDNFNKEGKYPVFQNSHSALINAISVTVKMHQING